MSTDKEFYDLLDTIAAEQTFTFDIGIASEPVTTVTCKQLTTLQLKDLVKSAVDSPLTQSIFSSTVAKIFKDSLVVAPGYHLNVLDRLLFILETRIQSFSQTKEVEHEGKTITVDFKKVATKLKEQVKSNKDKFSVSSATDGNITVEFGIPLLETEVQLNEEVYKDVEIDVQNTEQLRKIIGEAFINEIAKSIYSVTSKDKVMNFSGRTFKQRLKLVESLPASLIQKVITYIEQYKKVIESSITVNGYVIPIDSSLFSLR